MPGEPDQTRAIAISLGAGLLGAVQPDVNAALGERLDSSLLASLVNFLVALAVTSAVLSRRRGTRQHLADVRGWPVPGWTRLAGLGGAVVVLAGVVTVERLGVAVFSIAFFAGQMAFGLAVDRLGIAPGGRRPITRVRVGSVVLAMAAVVLAQLGSPVGDLAPDLVVFVVAAGAASALQSACNGRIASALGDPVAATALNVVVGTVCLASIAAVVALAGNLDPPLWPTEPWHYAGGLLGVTIVLALAAATSAIGVLRATIAMLAAQLVAAFMLDWVARHEPPTGGAVAAAVLLILAASLVNRSRVTPAAIS
ncbi:MAG: DMT family transporter [Acidimicrobiales bacterium]|nr:DMT family transporter [Acidimicrobiales bacterium]